MAAVETEAARGPSALSFCQTRSPAAFISSVRGSSERRALSACSNFSLGFFGSRMLPPPLSQCHVIFFERSTSAMQQHSHHGRRGIHHAGDLAVAVSFDEAENEHLRPSRIDPRQRLPQPVAQLAGFLTARRYRLN